MATLIPAESQRRSYAKLLEYLPKAIADELLSHHTAVTYAAGSNLFSHGSPADLIFWVISGLVKIYCPTGEEGRILVRIAGPGDALGFMYTVKSNSEELHAFEAQAFTKSVIALFSKEYVLKLLEKLDQATLVSLMERLNSSWTHYTYKWVNFLSFSFRQRLEFTFKDLASRFGVQDQRGTLLRVRLSHADLAEMIGSSRPMVTRLIGEMIADQSLYRHGKQYLIPARRRPDAPKLRELACWGTMLLLAAMPLYASLAA
jgi:CRP/FNR family cyclic AMP-dependent transcriptional regulator